MRKTWFAVALSFAGLLVSTSSSAAERWFEEFKAKATPRELYTFLYALPKGGDLHNHLQGAILSEWMWDAAIAEAAHGYFYYTKVRIQNCVPFGHNEFGRDPYLLLFKNLQELNYRKLDVCQQGEYKRLQDLDAREKAAWLGSLRLDQPYEGRDEFFYAIWSRIEDLLNNPDLIAAVLLKNMEAFGKEGVVYVEGQLRIDGYVKADGSAYTRDEVANLLRALFAGKEAKATGVEVRLQNALLRFAPDAEEGLKELYAINDRYRDLFVGVNMVGREDNNKGYPLRFLQTLRELRHRYPDVNLSIHAGEADEPNFHIKDTLLLGAKRIGHGVNLIRDPDTMVMLRNGPYLVEINLISNLLLDYVKDYSEHPFGEYLRLGVPVALSTDDRGMWDSNMTDEYYVAVREFNLSWEEMTQLGRNSLRFSFLDDTTKQKLLDDYEKRVQAFAQQFQSKGMTALKSVKPVSYSFTCRHYQLCIKP